MPADAEQRDNFPCSEYEVAAMVFAHFTVFLRSILCRRPHLPLLHFSHSKCHEPRYNGNIVFALRFFFLRARCHANWKFNEMENGKSITKNRSPSA